MLRKLMILKLLKNHFSFFDAFKIQNALRKKKEKVNLSNRNAFYFRKNSKDYETFEEIFLKNIYDIALPFIPNLIVDAGANVGFASCFFNLKYPLAKIIAVEIEDQNILMIEKNCSSIKNFEILKNALSNKKSYFKITNPFNATNSFQISEVATNENYDIESVTVSEILDNNFDADIDILKIDIEGAERFLFESNFENWLPKVKCIMIETHDRMFIDCTKIVVDTLTKSKFILYTSTEGTLIFYNLNHIKIYLK